MTKNWMRQLASHYETTRRLHPEEDLLILFDIDGTIVDMRQMILAVLQGYDRENRTTWFQNLRAPQISVQEAQLRQLLESRRLPEAETEKILAWYEEHRWSARALLQAHRPYHGVLEVIRWFQMQPRTFVGINSGRSEALRDETLRILNTLGREYRVHFSSELLHLNPHPQGQEVAESKANGLRRFNDSGYHVFAFVDDEPENLQATLRVDPQGETLLLHAATIFASKRTPTRAVRGTAYDLTELIDEQSLPQHIQFVWRGVNDEANLRQFLGSNIHWAEMDVRRDPDRDSLVLRECSFEDIPAEADERFLALDHLLARLWDHGAAVVLDLQGESSLEPVLETLERHGFDDRRLWFHAELAHLRQEGFRELARRHPESLVQCPIGFLSPLVQAAPAHAKGILEMLGDWGINRFALDWSIPGLRQVFERLDEWGVQVNITGVPDLEAFLQAALLVPRAITSDFNFPQWHYFGLGSGGQHHGRRYVEGAGRRA